MWNFALESIDVMKKFGKWKTQVIKTIFRFLGIFLKSAVPLKFPPLFLDTLNSMSSVWGTHRPFQNANSFSAWPFLYFLEFVKHQLMLLQGIWKMKFISRVLGPSNLMSAVWRTQRIFENTKVFSIQPFSDFLEFFKIRHASLRNWKVKYFSRDLGLLNSTPAIWDTQRTSKNSMVISAGPFFDFWKFKCGQLEWRSI